MRRILFASAGLVLLALPLLAACGDDSDDATPTTGATTTLTATTETVAPSQTGTAEATATGSAQPSSTAPSDGTVDPLGNGQQTPWDVKSDPDPDSEVAVLNDVRMGVHPELGGWERIVFEFQGDTRPAATIQYVDSASQCGSGEDTPIEGAAILEVSITGADAHDTDGAATVPTTIDGPGSVIHGGTQTCDFEAHVTWDFGLDAKHNFKVTTLADPVRIVIDVKQ